MLKVRWSQCLWQASVLASLDGCGCSPKFPCGRAESLWGVRWAGLADMTYQSQVTAHNGMVICIRHTQPQHQQQQHTKALPTTSLEAVWDFVNCFTYVEFQFSIYSVFCISVAGYQSTDESIISHITPHQPHEPWSRVKTGGRSYLCILASTQSDWS